MAIKKRQTKKQLLDDLQYLLSVAHKKGYILNHKDAFAIGYLAAKYDLKRINEVTDELATAVSAYDIDDELGLNDTIGEVFADLVPLEL